MKCNSGLILMRKFRGKQYREVVCSSLLGRVWALILIMLLEDSSIFELGA